MKRIKIADSLQNSIYRFRYLICGVLVVSFNFFGCGLTHEQDFIDSTQVQNTYVAKKTLSQTTLGVQVIAENLEVPWDIELEPNGRHLWFTQQKGIIGRIDPDSGKIEEVYEVPDVLYRKSYGLLSLALHPNFSTQPDLIIHYTYRRSNGIRSRLVSFRYLGGKLINRKVILEDIPGNTYHNGSRLLITHDNKVLFSMGDGGRDELAQDPDKLNGKILRLNFDGSIPEDNPIKGSPVWSMGHRNPQGLTQSPSGIIYGSEHGPAIDDEINIITPGANYGWPDVTGYCDEPYEIGYCDEHSVSPSLYSWSPSIAPCGIAFYNSDVIPEWKNSLIVGTLKNMSVRVLSLDETGKAIVNEEVMFRQYLGRIRDVEMGSDGDVYLSTSNRDWHPNSNPEYYQGLSIPADNDDRIIRLVPISKGEANYLNEVEEREESKIDLSVLSERERGIALFKTYCASCHKEDATGVKDLYPPLIDTDWVSDKGKLIETVINGLSGEIEVNGVTYSGEMPGFKFLSNEELRDVLNYVRSSFGNNAGPLTLDDINDHR